MERYLAIAGGLITILAFVPAIFFFFRAAQHFIQMLAHFRSGRHDLIANLIPFAAPFMPHLFTEQGNIHRHSFLVNFGWFLSCVAFIAVTSSFFDFKGSI